MDVQQAHVALLAFSGKNAGIGISIDLIKGLIETQLKRLNTHFSRMTSNQTFGTSSGGSHNVDFTGVFDRSNLTFAFVDFVNPNNANEFFPAVEINNLRVIIQGFVENQKVVEITVKYPTIRGMIHLVDKRIVISLFNETHLEESFDSLWKTDLAVRDFFVTNFNFTDNDWDDLEIYFKATSIFSGKSIAEAFINSLVLPDIFKVFNGIVFGEDGKLGADTTGNLLMFTASCRLNFNNCPTFNAAGQTRTTSSATIEGGDGTIFRIGETPQSENIVVETTIDESSPGLNYPPHADNIERIETGDVFLFTPVDLLRVNFDIVKPSITASASGGLGPIYWRYSVTSAVKSITLTLVNLFPPEFRLSLPSEVTGQAGAGVEIGCIRYEALGAMFDGLVDPCDINFKIYLDWATRQIVFISKLENIQGKNFRFRTFPSLDFPISEVIDFILGKAADYIISQQGDKILNITRIPIANLGILEDVAELIHALAGETDAAGNVTMGVKFRHQP